MIVVGTCVGPSDWYEKMAAPAIARCLPEARVVVVRDQRSIFRAYNSILDQARMTANLEALVLIHDDVELRDRGLVAKLRAALDGDVAIVGVIGSQRPTRVAWTSGSPTVGRAIDHCGPAGTRQVLEGESSSSEADTVDGLFLALSPWAVENLRFDQRRYWGFDGYDADICAQARAAGKRVVVAPIDLVHHATDGGNHRVMTGSGFTRANLVWKSKWRNDAPRWKRLAWRLRGELLPLEYRLRGLPWR